MSGPRPVITISYFDTYGKVYGKIQGDLDRYRSWRCVLPEALQLHRDIYDAYTCDVSSVDITLGGSGAGWRPLRHDREVAYARAGISALIALARAIGAEVHIVHAIDARSIAGTRSTTLIGSPGN